MKTMFFIITGIAFIGFIALGLFGAFDNDKDNPFKNN